MTTTCQPAALSCSAQRPGICPASLVPDVDREAVAQRLAECRPHYRLATPEHRAALEQLVTCSIRLEHCRAQESALLRCERTRASLRWDQDRRAEAEALGKGLARRPSLVASQLQQTKQGVEWMLERWRLLGALLEEQQGAWDARQTAQALDLIGRPRELRPRKPTVADPSALVAEQVARLERLKEDSLDTLDAMERDMARAGTPVETSEAMLRLRRYEAACLREYRRAAQELLAQRVTPPPPAPAPAPEPATAEPEVERPQGDPGPAVAGAVAVPSCPPRRVPAAGRSTPANSPASAGTAVYVPIMVTGSRPARLGS